MIAMIIKRAVLYACVALWCSGVLVHSIYAQDQKIVATTIQQYNNSVRNASFESWSQGSSAIPDAWSNESTPIYLKLTNDKMVDSASLKVTATALGQGLKQVVSVEPNTTYTASFYYKVDSGGSMTFNITGSQQLINQAGFNSTAWKRVSYAFYTATADTSITIKMTADGAYTFYVDGVMLTKGYLTPAYEDYGLTDTGDQTVYGNVTATGTISGATISEGGANLINKYVPLAGNVNITGGLNIATTSGNVGIGTMGPTGGKLHVEGQCVTGDTVLPIIRMMDDGWWMMDKEEIKQSTIHNPQSSSSLSQT